MCLKYYLPEFLFCLLTLWCFLKMPLFIFIDRVFFPKDYCKGVGVELWPMFVVLISTHKFLLSLKVEIFLSD